MLKFPVLKSVLKVCTIVAAVAFGSSTLKADTMTFAGNAKGCFGTSCSAGTTSSFNTLTYYGSTFNDTTSTSGFLAFGSVAKTDGTNFNNFGSLALSTATATYSGNPFSLLVTFTMPSGITGGQASTFAATVFGQVTSTNGGVQLVFSPATQSYSFNNGTQTGTFTLTLNNVSVNNGNVSNLSGFIQANVSAATPEPSSLMLLGTGLVSTAGMMIRRRRNTTV